MVSYSTDQDICSKFRQKFLNYSCLALVAIVVHGYLSYVEQPFTTLPDKVKYVMWFTILITVNVAMKNWDS